MFTDLGNSIIDALIHLLVDTIFGQLLTWLNDLTQPVIPV